MEGMKNGSIAVSSTYEEGGVKQEMGFDEEDLGKLCLSGSLLIGSRGNVRTDESELVMQENGVEMQENAQSQTLPNDVIETNVKEEGIGKSDGVDKSKEENNDAQKISDEKPLVIIYHTHATESYQPAAEGNFHIIEEASTVREVGNVLTQALEAKGIQVVHDKTLHDSPSYNQSYSRSLETINSLLAQYPNADMVIDLHRDAAAYTGGAGKTVLVNGETVAKYSLVVGNGNANAQTLKTWAGKINKTAESLYPGFGGKIIEKAYKFNQYVSDKHILLEIGNNENNIKESNACAKYFADVVAEVLKQ